jgi:hypothetical protein
MRRQLGRYQVVGDTAYRGHEPGTTFVARLDVHTANRAIDRGNLKLLGLAVDDLEPGSWRLPQGWLQTNEARR